MPRADLNMGRLLNYESLAVVGLWAAVLWWVVRRRGGKSWLTVAMGCLLVLPVMFAVVRTALSRNVDASLAGPWLVRGYLSWLYALVACGAFCILDIRKACQSHSAGTESDASRVPPSPSPV